MASAYGSRRKHVPESKPSDPLLGKWQERRQQAKNDRSRYEPSWHLCQSYLAGRQWVGWNSRERRIISLQEHPDWKLREKHTVNIITSHVWNVLARVMDGDLRPDITFRREDLESETFAEMASKAWEYNWDEELDAISVLRDVILKELCYGTSAVRCIYDPDQGPSIGEVPIVNGQPITNPEEAMQLVAQAQMEGRTVRFKEMKEGRTVWEPLGPFNLLTPPGIEFERDFPWIIVDRPVSIERLKGWFGKKADGLESETVSAIDQAWTREASLSDPGGANSSGDLKEHAMLSVAYELPCPDYPQGMTITFVRDRILDVQKQLPYMLEGVPRVGIAFFHYHKVPGRFWSQGIVEPAMGIQRQINRARSQNIEAKDRNLGRVYAYRGTITQANEPIGKISELIEVTPGHDFPQETTGPGPGNWIQAEADISMNDLDRVLGSSEVSRGNPPGGVSAYSALSLLAEQSERQIGPVIRQAREAITELAKLTMHNIRLYWPQNKMVAVAGTDGLMDAFVFQSAQLPESIYIQYPEGVPRPRSQAAEIQKAFDLYDRSVAAGRPLPIDWLAKSLNSGKVDQLPSLPGDAQQGKAEMENMLIARGQMVMPASYDDDMLHVEVHRSAQTAHDLLPGGEQLTQMYEQHIQMHILSHQMKMMQAAQMGALQPGMMPMPGMGGPAPTGPAGLPPPLPGTEMTAQRGPLGPVGSPGIASMNGG